MKIRALPLVVFLGCSSSFHLNAGSLPILDGAPWTGYFTACEHRNFHFGMGSDGGMKLMPLNSEGAPPDNYLIATANFVVEEVQPDGTSVAHEIDPESLNSAQTAALNPTKPMVMTGKTKDGIEFSTETSIDHGVVKLGGKVTNAGGKTNPMRIAIRFDIPNAYPADQREDAKQFAKRIRRDEVAVDRVDGSRGKYEGSKAVDGAKDVSGKGLRMVWIDFEAYQKKKPGFSIQGNAAITMVNDAAKPLFDGFQLWFRPDPAKDPDGLSRLMVTVK